MGKIFLELAPEVVDVEAFFELAHHAHSQEPLINNSTAFSFNKSLKTFGVGF